MKDRISMMIAWWLPARVAMWAFIRVSVYATAGEYGDTVVPALTCMEAVARWAQEKGIK